MFMLGLQILMEKSIPNKIQEITVLLNFALFSRKPLAEIKSLKWWMSHPIEGIAPALRAGAALPLSGGL